MGISNPETNLTRRLDRLRKTQNPDGGWAFYQGKSSWLEPTVYAALALEGQPEADRAWQLVRNWQLASGGWRPTARVEWANWTTAHAVLLAGRKPGQEAAVQKGVEWLRNNTKEGAWSWRRANLPAAEPTVMAVLALRSAGVDVPEPVEKFLLSGNLGPETCGMALLGLQGTTHTASLAPLAARWAEETASPLSRAWIEIGLRVNGWSVPESGEVRPLPRNLGAVALEALAESAGNHRVFKVEGKA